MNNIFSGSEVIEMGINIEKNGRDFYNKVSSSSKNKKAKEIFDFLAKEEEKHIERFEVLLNGVEKYEPQGAYSGDYFSYIKALSDEHVFTKKDKGSSLAETVSSDIQAIDMAIGFERDSILFYHEMKRFTLEKEAGIVDKLLDEERAHLTRLLGLRRVLWQKT
ncbi:MAG: ferritin family protein [Candidatus Omnitrophota bacterium]